MGQEDYNINLVKEIPKNLSIIPQHFTVFQPQLEYFFHLVFVNCLQGIIHKKDYT